MDVAEGEDDVGAAGGNGGGLAGREGRHLDLAIDRIAGDLGADPLIIAAGGRDDMERAARCEVGREISVYQPPPGHSSTTVSPGFDAEEGERFGRMAK